MLLIIYFVLYEIGVVSVVRRWSCESHYSCYVCEAFGDAFSFDCSLQGGERPENPYPTPPTMEDHLDTQPCLRGHEVRPDTRGGRMSQQKIVSTLLLKIQLKRAGQDEKLPVLIRL